MGMGKQERLSLGFKYNVTKSHARLAKVPFKLTMLEFNEIQHKPCTFCGSPGEPLRKDPTVLWSRVALRNQLPGFTLENAIPICERCYRTQYV